MSILKTLCILFAFGIASKLSYPHIKKKNQINQSQTNLIKMQIKVIIRIINIELYGGAENTVDIKWAL